LPNYILATLETEWRWRIRSRDGSRPRSPFAEQVALMPVTMKIKGKKEKYVLPRSCPPGLIDAVISAETPIQRRPLQSGRIADYTCFPGHVARPRTLWPGIYDRTKVCSLLDAIPSMDHAGQLRADMLLIWDAGLCLLHKSFIAPLIFPADSYRQDFQVRGKIPSLFRAAGAQEIPL